MRSWPDIAALKVPKGPSDNFAFAHVLNHAVKTISIHFVLTTAQNDIKYSETVLALLDHSFSVVDIPRYFKFILTAALAS